MSSKPHSCNPKEPQEHSQNSASGSAEPDPHPDPSAVEQSPSRSRHKLSSFKKSISVGLKRLGRSRERSKSRSLDAGSSMPPGDGQPGAHARPLSQANSQWELLEYEVAQDMMPRTPMILPKHRTLATMEHVCETPKRAVKTEVKAIARAGGVPEWGESSKSARAAKPKGSKDAH